MVGLIGNALVVWVIAVGTRLKSMADVCLLNLALADLLLVLSLPFLAHHFNHYWIFGSAMCALVYSMHFVGFYGGIFFIVLMSIDRYLAVVHAVFAIRVRTKACGIVASLVIWILAVGASFPELLYIKVTKSTTYLLCSPYPLTSNSDFYRAVGIFKMNIVGLLIPLTVVGFCYSMVLQRLHRSSSSKKHAMRLIVLVIVVFFCCWAPYNIAAFLRGLQIMGVISETCKFTERIQLTLQITEAVAFSHSCLNPVLYVFVGEKFRRHLVRLVRETLKGAFGRLAERSWTKRPGLEIIRLWLLSPSVNRGFQDRNPVVMTNGDRSV
ncbi:C-C chemokine receptor type 4-like [Salminus brasiliensis]|uniref:C-C chemokine receptor type 4-like n=1 Tax=Salminus brasiliensis TaxID=930266 RepID=UPI003B82D7E2